MDFFNHRHFKESGMDFFCISGGNQIHNEINVKENSKNSVNLIFKHQGKSKDHVIVLIDACSPLYDTKTHGLFPDAHAYTDLFDWIESKSGRPISNDSVLIFHNEGEALIYSDDYYFCKLLLEKYPELTLILFSASAHGKITSRSFKKLFGSYDNCFHVCNNDWYPKGINNVHRTPDYLKNYPKEKTFVCIGGGLRFHRKLLIYNLCHNNLLDNGFVTYNIQPGYPKDSTIMPDGVVKNYDQNIYDMWIERGIHNKLPDNMTLYNDEDLWSGEYPVMSKGGHTHAWLHVPDLDYPFYENSYVTLLPETSWWSSNTEYFRKCFVDFECSDYSAPSNFFSEKTYRALINAMPFVMLNTPHSLESLRQMGFRTYHPYIDETYDTLEDDQDRMASLIQTLTKLRDDPPDRATVEKMKEIADHNRNLLTKLPRHVIITNNKGIKI